MRSYIIILRNQETNRLVFRAPLILTDNIEDVDPNLLTQLITSSIYNKVISLKLLNISDPDAKTLQCYVCDHTWKQRGLSIPRRCPKCLDKDWQKPEASMRGLP